MTYGRIYPEAGDLHTQPDSSSTDDLTRHSQFKASFLTGKSMTRAGRFHLTTTHDHLGL
ncbi:hypothetical protein CABS01_07224 [Colletotrichum abscissum]|uniref:uncharacterized protein n=1 Tax=Colletotrichum abscissum TaxID=1671311 RepID=UPI0027D6F39F|nr:uncharacterized protein CABS01_07224 [Colletotrichum abscissum]KAK1513818.1 hypothetical protein CABS01_07224 [Colletotrichum abscissum]